MPRKCFHCRFRDSNVDFDTEIATPQESSSEICITYDGIHKHRQRLVNSQVSVHNYPISLFTDNKIHKKAKETNETEISSFRKKLRIGINAGCVQGFYFDCLNNFLSSQLLMLIFVDSHLFET